MSNDSDWVRQIEARANAATAGPWISFVEGRDFTSGSSFIRTAGSDIELAGATIADQDFIAHARQDVLELIQEVRRRAQNCVVNIAFKGELGFGYRPRRRTEEPLKMRKAVIYADFNNIDRDGFLRLNNRGTIDDLAGASVMLVEGLKLLFSDGDLTAEGIVRQPGVEGVWRAQVVGDVRERDPDSTTT